MATGLTKKFTSLLLVTTLSLGMLGTALAEVILHRGNSGEPETLDPAKSSGTWEAHIQRDLFEGLLAEAADGELIPGAAESWEIDDKGLVYTFKLREDAKWSNGEPVTADDFVYALERLLDPMTASKYATIMYPVLNAEAINTGEIKDLGALGAEATDERTLKITLHSPTPYTISLEL